MKKNGKTYEERLSASRVAFYINVIEKILYNETFSYKFSCLLLCMFIYNSILHYFWLTNISLISADFQATAIPLSPLEKSNEKQRLQNAPIWKWRLPSIVVMQSFTVAHYSIWNQNVTTSKFHKVNSYLSCSQFLRVPQKRFNVKSNP